VHQGARNRQAVGGSSGPNESPERVAEEVNSSAGATTRNYIDENMDDGRDKNFEKVNEGATDNRTRHSSKAGVSNLKEKHEEGDRDRVGAGPGDNETEACDKVGDGIAGTTHIFKAGVVCFSFDPRRRHHKTLAQVRRLASNRFQKESCAYLCL